MKVQMATMILLDAKGCSIITTRYVVYHSGEWQNALSLGYKTHTVSEVEL